MLKILSLSWPNTELITQSQPPFSFHLGLFWGRNAYNCNTKYEISFIKIILQLIIAHWAYKDLADNGFPANTGWETILAPLHSLN